MTCDGHLFTGAVRLHGRARFSSGGLSQPFSYLLSPSVSAAGIESRFSRGVFLTARGPGLQDSYLVDSASSHMLVSKIKPCMSKYKQSYCETANGSLNQLSFI
jgi:hypothetical protein